MPEVQISGVHSGSYKEAILFLVTAGVVVPLFHRLRISPVLGFIGAGALLGPFGLGRFAETHHWVSTFTIANRAEIAFTLYAAVILSFLGGTRWGREVVHSMAVPRGRELTLAILPSLGGWLAAVAHLGGFKQMAWAGLILAFALLFFWDWRGAKDGTWPEWYGRLRLLLSFGAILSAAVMILLNV